MLTINSGNMTGIKNCIKALTSCIASMTKAKTPTTSNGGAPPQPMEMPQIEVPPFVEALIKTVPPPLLVVGVLAFVMLVMQLVGALMQFLAPVMFPLFLVLNFAPQNLRAPLMLGLVATSLATAFL